MSNLFDLVLDDLNTLRNRAKEYFSIRIGWSSGLEIIALVLTFVSMLLYGAFVGKFSRSS